MIDRLFDMPVYGLTQREKHAVLAEEMRELTAHHRAACPPYDAILEGYGEAVPPGGVEAPFLPVSIFKLHDLASVPREAVFKTMTSSGTTGQQPSRIYLDADTARNQTRVLVKIMTSFLGPKRLPMLIIDHPSVVKDRRSFSARGAGILGMMTFGRQHIFALKDETMELDWEAIDQFAEVYEGQPIFAFGFTFMVWRYLLQALERSGRKLPFRDAILVHSGGWKKLEDEKVSNEVFKSQADALGGFGRVHNFYGMVEQTGSVFVECEAGRLHAPLFADVVIRDPLDWRECAVGETGVIQVLSVLPRSYPGHSLLTEDKGVLLGEDDCPCGRLGRTFAVHGRIPKAEVRGCSDTFSQSGSQNG
ncbi:acyl-protein synthetase [Novosphingobium sp. G106]|uniref:LuxE/PaaK family acyltransferase n=1 Tax=Novosphingobium sp. G106 TaxID=2849500 RepID=UPI001C2DE70B|nr:acyl-protein synthetase [Novosphingobium sp. G106]MBV1689577.1 acyl-protein synthetase [Novosphingobium sp. G106]